MRMPSKQYLNYLRSTYPPGTRVQLIYMDDVQAPPIGTAGTVIGIDGMGGYARFELPHESSHQRWDGDENPIINEVMMKEAGN